MAALPQKATHQQTRTFNQQLVLRAIYDRDAVSRADLARLTGLTRTSVSELVGELLRDGLVEEVGRGPSTGGKSPIMVGLRAEGRHLIGLDLGEAVFSGAVVDMRGRILKSLRVPLAGHDGAEAVELVLELIDGLVSSNGSSPALGIGIGAPGVIDSRTGSVRWAVNLNWADLALGPLVAERFGLPVVVVNDSQAAAVAEFNFGFEARPQNLVVVRVGRGVGAGIILDGRLFQGDGSGAGEIGHASVRESDERAQRCRCGRTGCLENYVSVPAMIAAARAGGPPVSDLATLVDAFGAGDAHVRAIVLEAATQLGRSIGALISTLDVHHVVLIGPATQLGEEWLDAVRAEARRSALPLLAQDTRIELGRARDDDVLIGAAALLMTHELGLSLAR